MAGGRAAGRSTQLARELGLGVGLYGDYAVGVNASGSETWSDQTLYCMGAAIGAPPDPLGVAGQEWGIPPQDPRQLRRTAYAPFAALVRASMRNCGALRLDHVMALFRQWWVPRGFKSVDGGYVHYPLEDLLGVVTLESQRNQCLIVGEDLGVVPDEIGVRCRSSVSITTSGDVRTEGGSSWRRRLPASCARHGDHPRSAHLAWLVDRHDIGLWKNSASIPTPASESRRAPNVSKSSSGCCAPCAVKACGPRTKPSRPDHESAAPAYSAQLSRAVHEFLGRSAAALVTVQLEDMIGMLEPVNIPGTSSEYSNWTRRMSASASEIFARPDVRELAAAITASRNMPPCSRA